MIFVHHSMSIWSIMTEANDYDFEKIDDSLKCFKGVLVESLGKVCAIETFRTYGFSFIANWESTRLFFHSHSLTFGWIEF